MKYKTHKHACSIDLGSDSMLPESYTWWGKLWRKCRMLAQLSMHHPDTTKYYRSYSAVVAERQRQLLEEGGGVIHPLSLLSIFWMTFMVALNISCMTIFPYRLFFMLEPAQALRMQPIDKQLLVLHVLCFADVVMRFNMGYVDKKFSSIVFDRKTIFSHYVKGFLLIDMLSCTPLAFLLLWLGHENPRVMFIAHILPLLRILRICTIKCSTKTLTKLFTNSYIVIGLVRIAVLLAISIHWCACLMYLPPVLIYYWTGKMPRDYNCYLQDNNEDVTLLDFTNEYRYIKAIIIVISAFLHTGFSMFHSKLPDELLIHSCIIAFAAMFMVFTLVFLVKAYLTMYDTSKRYHSLMNEVEQYMALKQFPTPLKERVRAFYEYRYQQNYFKEERNLSCLSEQLRDEVRLHTSRILIHKVKLFEGVSPVTVGTVLGCLRSEVVLANDLVSAAGDVGDCMYFIANGTVAMYTFKGVEINHLGDGEHFGEGALLMKDHKRMVTVVAVETTQLYRLSAAHFNRFVMTHSVLRRRIEEKVSVLMHQIVLRDDIIYKEVAKRMSHTQDNLVKDT